MVSNSTISLTCACVVNHAQFKISVALCELGKQAVEDFSSLWGDTFLGDEVKILWAKGENLKSSLKSRCIANCFMT